jgi:hypothetical protein
MDNKYAIGKNDKNKRHAKAQHTAITKEINHLSKGDAQTYKIACVNKMIKVKITFTSFAIELLRGEDSLATASHKSLGKSNLQLQK